LGKVSEYMESLNSTYRIYIIFCFTIADQIAESLWIRLYVGLLHVFEDPQGTTSVFLQFQKGEKMNELFKTYSIYLFKCFLVEWEFSKRKKYMK